MMPGSSGVVANAEAQRRGSRRGPDGDAGGHSRPNISTMPWAVRCSAPSASCRNTIPRAPNGPYSTNTARRLHLRLAGASSLSTWAPVTAARPSRGCPSSLRHAISPSISPKPKSRSHSRQDGAGFSGVGMLGIVAVSPAASTSSKTSTRDRSPFSIRGRPSAISLRTKPPAFLRDVHRMCVGREGSGLLIGVDTKKDKGTNRCRLRRCGRRHSRRSTGTCSTT